MHPDEEPKDGILYYYKEDFDGFQDRGLKYEHPNGTLLNLKLIAQSQEFAEAAMRAAKEMDNLLKRMDKTEAKIGKIKEIMMPETAEPKEIPLDACEKHGKKPGHFWSSCAECHKARMKHHANLRAKGQHPENALIETATTKALKQ